MLKAHGINILIRMEPQKSPIILPDYLSFPCKFAEVITVGDKVLEDIKVGDRILLPEPVYGWEQSDGTSIIRESWILGIMEAKNGRTKNRCS